MKYREFVDLLKSKNILLKDVLSYIGMTRPGLSAALDNETIELRRLKLLCEFVRITPAQFFESGTFGSLQHNPISESKKVGELEKEIIYLKQSLKDKDEIINLLREKDRGYRSMVAEPTNYETKLKK